MKQMRQYKPLNRADVVKAFASPAMTRREVMDIVKRYMGNSPVPPSWTYASVRGTFGKRVARHWARHLRHRPPGSYRDAQTGIVLHSFVQTAYDFGTTPDKLAAMRESSQITAAEACAESSRLRKDLPFIIDEYHRT